MSTFAAEVVEIDRIEPHPNADRLKIAHIGGYACIVGKDGFEEGERVVYVPEGAIVPADVLEEAGLTGRLAGKTKDRVKAIKLRGVLSQGIVLRIPNCRMKEPAYSLGHDATEELGLVKYVPTIPTSMSGEVEPMPDSTLAYDVESWQKFPDLFRDGDIVILTEKIHGTFCGVAWNPEKEAWYVFSKGLGAKGLAFKRSEKNLEKNVHCRTIAGFEEGLSRIDWDFRNPIIFLGEVYGKGVQDLHYGVVGNDKGFRVFDVYGGWRDRGSYYDWSEVERFCAEAGIETVPVINFGEWDTERVRDEANGKTLIGDGHHIREGVVVRSFEERTTNGQRHVLKMVGEDYLLRKGGTEHE